MEPDAGRPLLGDRRVDRALSNGCVLMNYLYIRVLHRSTIERVLLGGLVTAIDKMKMSRRGSNEQILEFIPVGQVGTRKPLRRHEGWGGRCHPRTLKIQSAVQVTVRYLSRDSVAFRKYHSRTQVQVSDPPPRGRSLMIEMTRGMADLLSVGVFSAN